MEKFLILMSNKIVNHSAYGKQLKMDTAISRHYPKHNHPLKTTHDEQESDKYESSALVRQRGKKKRKGHMQARMKVGKKPSPCMVCRGGGKGGRRTGSN